MNILRFVLLIMLLTIGPALSHAPNRIVSMNLCTDQMVLQLAKPGAVVSVSFLTADPAESPEAYRTRGLYLNYGHAEEVIALDPDLVVTGRYTTSAAKVLLRRLGYEIAEVDLPLSFEGVRQTYRDLGVRLGREQAAEDILFRFDQRFSEIEARFTRRASGSVLILDANGFSVGRPSLIDEVLTRIGLTNLASVLGIGDFGQITIEAVLMAKPDHIVRMDYRSNVPSLANQTLSHPALSSYLGSREMISVPQSWLNCGGPYLADAAERVVELIEQAINAEMAP